LGDSVFGFLSSALAISLTYPADTLARQNQVSLVQIKPSQQSWRTLYKGLGSALITQPTYWACYWPLYSWLSVRTNESELCKRFPFATGVIVSFSAAGVATVVTNPLWTIRQRMQTEWVKRKSQRYMMLMSDMYGENGLKTFFRGTGVSLIKNIQTGLLVPIFLKIRKLDFWEKHNVPPVLSAGASGALAKMLAATWLYPIDVVRTNMRFVERKIVPFSVLAREVVSARPHIRLLYRGIGWYWLSSCGIFAIMMALDSLRPVAFFPK